jgi:hypothetical protein
MPDDFRRREAAMTKRELIEPKPGDKRYARRHDERRFTNDQTDVERSSAAASCIAVVARGLRPIRAPARRRRA